MSVRQMPDVPASGSPQFAGAGISIGGGSGGGSGGLVYSTEETKIGSFNGKDLYSRIIPSSDFYYKQNINVQDSELCNKSYIAEIESIVSLDMYYFSSNQLKNATDRCPTMGRVYGGVLFGETKSGYWEYEYNANNIIVITYTKKTN